MKGGCGKINGTQSAHGWSLGVSSRSQRSAVRTVASSKSTESTVPVSPKYIARWSRWSSGNGEVHRFERRRTVGWFEEAAHVGTRLGDTRCEHVAAIARDCDSVPGGTERLEQVRLVILDQVVEGSVPGHVWIPAGQERHATRTTHRVLRPGVVEAYAALGECVDVGRLRNRTAETPQRVGVQLVGHEEHEVRLPHLAHPTHLTAVASVSTMRSTCSSVVTNGGQNVTVSVPIARVTTPSSSIWS